MQTDPDSASEVHGTRLWFRDVFKIGYEIFVVPSGDDLSYRMLPRLKPLVRSHYYLRLLRDLMLKAVLLLSEDT